METCRSVSTPLSLTVEKEGHRSDRSEVSAELATKLRAAVARCCVLGPGSAGFGSGGTLAIPREGDDERLKPVARYLHGRPDDMQWYTVQEDTNTVVLTTHIDWATCQASR